MSNFVSHLVIDDLSWGKGNIVPRRDQYSSPKDQQDLIEAVVACIEKVSDDQAPFSICTDGRLPVRLLDGDSVPVREQMVGADIVSAFYVAEIFGDEFYKDPSQPLIDRIREVAEFMQKNGIIPSSHLKCGAATAFVDIAQNIIEFSKLSAFVERVKRLLPDDKFDQEIYDNLIAAGRKRVESKAYEGMTPQMFLDVVEPLGGLHAIAELKDDGRGVHGHVEECIVRIRVPDHALNIIKLAEMTNGREVFCVNDPRMARLAQLLAAGDDVKYCQALIALEQFADAAHATLVKDLPTYIIERAK